MKIARVFPRITKATPTDELVFTDCPPMFMPEIDEVHVSVVFTYDMKHAEWLAMQWRSVGVPVKMGGPAYNLSLIHISEPTRLGMISYAVFCLKKKKKKKQMS